MQPKRKGPSQTENAKPAQKIEYKDAPNMSSVYSNNVFLRLTPWDIQLTFGDILSGDQTTLLVENRLRVYLSPQTAKALSKALMASVQQYEAQIGEIKYGAITIQQELE
jgi:hypothetical protein